MIKSVWEFLLSFINKFILTFKGIYPNILTYVETFNLKSKDFLINEKNVKSLEISFEFERSKS